MREIKFRAFDEESKKLYQITDINFSDYVANGVCYGDWEDFSINNLLQYTGLKDKNDVEIYEGDIIRSHNSRQGEKIEDYEVIYAGSGFCIKSLKENEIHSKGTLYSFALYSDNIDFLKDDYIIGNIHENPELLN